MMPIKKYKQFFFIKPIKGPCVYYISYNDYTIFTMTMKL